MADPTADDIPVEHEPTIAFEPGETTAPSVEQRVEGAFGWALIVETGPQAGLTYVLGPGETTVGRDPSSDIFLGDVTVSRHHARFHVDDTGLTVTDVGSTNGTYVNGVRVEKARLQPGDELFIGKFHLLVAKGTGTA